MEMVWVSAAYATIETPKTSHRLDTLWKKERGKAKRHLKKDDDPRDEEEEP